MSSSPSRRRLVAAAALALAVGLPLASARPALAQTPGSVLITGHGFGHGRGLGQYGALGYAQDMGWQHTQILDHFYGGTTMGSVPAGTTLRVRITKNRTGLAQDLGDSITVTSGVPFTVGGQLVDAGRGVRIYRSASNWLMDVSVTCGSAVVHTQQIASGLVFPSVFDPGNNPDQMITICNAGGTGENRTYRGTIELLIGDGILRTVNTVTSEQYLRSVVPREMPASWHPQALASQAIAARSYGLAERRFNWADTCSTDQCQVYYGYGSSPLSGGLTVHEDSRTDAAIVGTANLVRRTSGGAIARTEFSSSTGGYTAGGTFPAVPDLGDATSSNPNHSWTVSSITHAAIASRYGVGSLLDIAVTATNGLGADGGRALTVTIRGTSGTVTRTGDQFRSDWTLKSDWFTIADGLDFLDWYLRGDNSAGPPALSITYGAPTNRPVLGDWDDTFTETVGVYDRGNWYLRNSNSPGAPALSFAYGGPNDIPLVGDWGGGAGPDGIGVYSGGTFYLRNTASPGAPDLPPITYGGPGAVPVVGDWDGDGTVTIGVYVNGNWYLRNSNTPGPPDIAVNYGGPGDRPVVGDWDGGSGPDTIGVFSSGNWYLRTSNTPGPPNLAFAFGAPGYIPVTGDHDGNGGDTVGVAVP